MTMVTMKNGQSYSGFAYGGRTWEAGSCGEGQRRGRRAAEEPFGAPAGRVGGAWDRGKEPFGAPAGRVGGAWERGKILPWWRPVGEGAKSPLRSVDRASQRLGQTAQGFKEPLEAGKVERLRAVGKGVVGLGVDLDQ